MRSIPRLAQWVKDPELPLLLGWRLWPRSDLCSRSSICLGVAKKKKKKKAWPLPLRGLVVKVKHRKGKVMLKTSRVTAGF